MENTLDNWIINELPPEGSWWCDSSCEEYLMLAQILMREGWEEPDIKDFLERAYIAVQEEFGN